MLWRANAVPNLDKTLAVQLRSGELSTAPSTGFSVEKVGGERKQKEKLRALNFDSVDRGVFLV